MATVIIGDNTGDDIAGCVTTRIEQISPDDTAFGDSLNLRGPGSQQRNGLIEFTGTDDVSLNGVTVNSAIIRISFNGGLFGEIWTFYQLLRNWVYGQATWNSFSAGNAWATPGAQGTGDSSATSSGSQSTPLSAGNMDITLTAAGIAVVQNAIDTGSRCSFLIVSDSDGSQPGSGNDATDGSRPRLILDVTSGGGATGNPWYYYAQQ